MRFPLRRVRFAAVIAAGVAAGLTLTALAMPGAQASTSDLRLVRTTTSLLGTHQWYVQTYDGHDVLGSFYLRNTDAKTGRTTTLDGRRTIGSPAAGVASFGRARAASVAENRTSATASANDLVVLPGKQAKLAYAVITDSNSGEWRTLIDAGSGKVLKVEDLADRADGQGRVFDPNAVVTLQNESLTDQNNADYPAIAGAYKSVTLTHLDGSGHLDGDFASNTSRKEVTSTTNTFNYNRSQVGFEQTEAYWAITSTQTYIQGLGFTNVNNEAQDFRTTGLTADNSYYSPQKDQITFGTGGVDDAEDAEVIWHEYGHAIQDAQVPGFGSGNEAGSIGEGFGDWWAVINSIPSNPDTSVTPLACVADWDSVSYTSGTPHCLRRTDGNKVYPGDIVGEVHADGEIWSRALFDIYQGLGRDQAAKVVLEAQFSFAPNTSFPAAAQTTVNTARTLYGDTAATTVQNAFHARGIL